VFHLCLGSVGLMFCFLGRKIQLGNLIAGRRPSVSSVFGNGWFDLFLSWQEDLTQPAVEAGTDFSFKACLKLQEFRIR